jgi:hypothetical protein
VALSGGQEKHSNISYYFAAATARVITNIPTSSGCQILDWVVYKLSRWYSSSPTAVSSVLRGSELIHFDHVIM